MNGFFVIALGYAFVTALMGLIFLSTTIIYRHAIRLNKHWVQTTYLFAGLSLIPVIIVNVFFKHSISIIGDVSQIKFSWLMVQLIVAVVPASFLAARARPKPHDQNMVIDALNGALMEIPCRALVQNLFIVFGAKSVIFSNLTLAILLTAIIFVQFILTQTLLSKQRLGRQVLYDSMASLWFSIWIGIIYATTGSLFLTMIAHGIERLLANTIRKHNHLQRGE